MPLEEALGAVEECDVVVALAQAALGATQSSQPPIPHIAVLSNAIGYASNRGKRGLLKQPQGRSMRRSIRFASGGRGQIP